ncbi:MAG: EI24 domain-containing protein [Pseudoprimorskyibacter sp.]|nr:EI24 domain-containing protein [Pseudoprimorskyibacter sp.]
MIFTAFFKTLGQIGEPRFRRVFFRGVGLTLALLVAAMFAVQGLVSWATPETIVLPFIGEVAGLGILAGVGAFFATFVLSVFLMVPVCSAVTSLFLDEIAQAVEDRHYAHLPKARRVPLSEALTDSLLFLGQLIVANLLAFGLYLLLPFAAPFIFWLMNGFLLGREYFTMAAIRRVGRAEAQVLRRENLGVIWLAGIFVAVPLSIPLLNLFIPILGAATFTHIYHRIR